MTVKNVFKFSPQKGNLAPFDGNGIKPLLDFKTDSSFIYVLNVLCVVSSVDLVKNSEGPKYIVCIYVYVSMQLFIFFTMSSNSEIKVDLQMP